MFTRREIRRHGLRFQGSVSGGNSFQLLLCSVIIDLQFRTICLMRYSLEEYLEWQAEGFSVSKEKLRGYIAAIGLTLAMLQHPAAHGDH